MLPFSIAERPPKQRENVMLRSRRSFVALIALAVVFMVGMGNPGNAGSDEVTAAINVLNTQWDDAFNGKDAGKVAALYAEDGRVVTGDGNVLNGRTEIQGLFQGFMDSGFHDHKIDMVDVKVKGDIAYETAKWSGVGGDKKSYGGHLVNIYERQSGGDWQAVLHIWN